MLRTEVPTDSPRSERFNQRVREIVDKSAKAFAQRGFHGTSTVQLCEVNDLGKGALYYYIGSKERLLAAIHDRVMDEVMVGAERAERDGGMPAEQLAMMGAALVDVIARYPDHVWIFLHEFPALTGEHAEQFRRRRREYEGRVEGVLRRGIEAGQFRPLDTKLVARAWLGMHNYTYLWLRSGGGWDPADVAACYAGIFVDGISQGAA
jgi:AcrR family transcriptional regulator